jgi:GNAT superfamily N-acetyltransferase
MDVMVRPGVPEDAPTLARLRWRWRVEETRVATDIAYESFVDFFTTWMLDHRATHLPFVAEADGRLAGMAWLSLSERVPAPQVLGPRSGDILSVYVIPELRRLSIGARLIESIIRYARDIQLGYLIVHSAADAVGFYQRIGFVDDGRWLTYPTLPSP